MTRRRWVRRVLTGRDPLPDPRQDLLSDLIRAAGYLDAILATARSLNAPDTVDLSTGALFVRMFACKVEIWIAMEQDQ